MIWDKSAENNFKQIIEKVPVFLRSIAQEKVAKKAESLAQKENRAEVGEKDVIDAFFLETPFGFHGPLKTDMEALGINYAQYGH